MKTSIHRLSRRISDAHKDRRARRVRRSIQETLREIDYLIDNETAQRVDLFGQYDAKATAMRDTVHRARARLALAGIEVYPHQYGVILSRENPRTPTRDPDQPATWWGGYVR